jgi:hypothetical protein
MATLANAGQTNPTGDFLFILAAGGLGMHKSGPLEIPRFWSKGDDQEESYNS